MCSPKPVAGVNGVLHRLGPLKAVAYGFPGISSVPFESSDYLAPALQCRLDLPVPVCRRFFSLPRTLRRRIGFFSGPSFDVRRN